MFFSGDAYSSVVHNFNNKQVAINQLRSTLNNIENETSQKQKDIENNNTQIEVMILIFHNKFFLYCSLICFEIFQSVACVHFKSH